MKKVTKKSRTNDSYTQTTRHRVCSILSLDFINTFFAKMETNEGAAMSENGVKFIRMAREALGFVGKMRV
jgi:hypothetical protein